jgi:hypothetical protein
MLVFCYQLVHFNLVFNYVLIHQVLEWDGVPLVGRSLEEVWSLIERTGEVADLLVEQGSDM